MEVTINSSIPKDWEKGVMGIYNLIGIELMLGKMRRFWIWIVVLDELGEFYQFKKKTSHTS